MIDQKEMMRLSKSTRKPLLMMLSDCFPDPDGGDRAARAWRLLTCAATTHRVYLAAVADRPVNLQRWRLAAKIASRVHIEPSRSRKRTQRTLNTVAQTWSHQHRFNLLLASSPMAWPKGNPLPTDHGICDLATTFDPHTPHTGTPVGLAGRLLPSWLKPDTLAATAPHALDLCGHVLVATPQQATQLNGLQDRAVVVDDDDPLTAWEQLCHTLHRCDASPPTVTVDPILTQTSPRKAA